MTSLLIAIVAVCQPQTAEKPETLVAELHAAIEKQDTDSLPRIVAKIVAAKAEAAAIKSLEKSIKSDVVFTRVAATLALSRLGKTDPSAIELLIAQFLDANEDVCLFAARGLAGIGKPAVEPLIACLKHDDPRIRRWSAYAIGEMKEKPTEAIPHLVANISHKTPIVRAEAISTLGSMKSAAKKAMPEITAALDDQDANVRATAAAASWFIDKQVDVPVAGLIKSLKNKKHPVEDRAASVDVLAIIGSQCDVEFTKETIVPALAAALDGAEVLLRYHVALAFGTLGPRAKAAVPALRRLAADSNPDVSMIAEAALKAVEGK